MALDRRGCPWHPVTMHRRVLLGLLLISGFAGLAWELLWVRLLTLSLGGTTLSFSTVLAVFFGGLAVGSRWAGGKSRAVARPVRAYALLEVGTGALGLLLYPVMLNLGRVVSWVDVGTGGGALTVRLLVAVLLLLPPTFLMGATLPFVSVAVIRDDADTGRGTAWIYGLNTLGACLGAWAVSFLLLPQLGVRGAVAVVAGLNFVAGAAAWVLARQPGGEGRSVSGDASPDAGRVELTKETRVVLVTAFVGGLFATGAQVVWGRTFSIILKGTTYALGSVLVSVLVGLALGSLLAAWASRRVRSLATVALGAQVAQLAGGAVFIGILPLSAYVLSSLTQAGWSPGVLRHADIVVVWLSLLVPTVASGAMFPLLVGVVERRAAHVGESLSRLYAANTLGCIVGSVAVGFWGLPSLGSGGALYALSLLLSIATALFAVVVAAESRLFSALAVAATMLVIAAFPEFDASAATNRRTTVSPDFFTALKQQRQTGAVESWRKEGDSATVAVRTEAGGSGLTLNGLGQGGRNAEPPHVIFESLLVAALPWAHAARHDRGLVVGLGAGGTVNALADLGVASLEVVELEPAVQEAVERIWKEESPLLRPGVSLIQDDARHHLLISAHREAGRYDFITSMPAHPWVAPALFTREFFALVKENLNETGVFSTWFGKEGMSQESMEALFGAFGAEFPHVLVYDVPQTGAFYVLASKVPLRFYPARFETLKTSKPFVGVDPQGVTAASFGSLVVAFGQASLSASQLVSTDDNAIIEFSAPTTARRSDPLAAFSQRALPLAAIEGADPDSMWLEMLEVSFGTPAGRLPQVPRRAEALARLETGLGPKQTELTTYLKARLAALRANRADALTAANALQTPALKERALVFAHAAGVTDASPAALRETALKALASFGHRPDVRAFRASLGAPDEGPALGAPHVDNDDPLAWLFVADPASAQPEPTSVARAGGALLRRVVAFESVELGRRTEATLRAWNAVDLMKLAEQLPTRALTQKQNRKIRAALEAGSRERYQEAVQLLMAAAEDGPLDTERLLLLLRSSLKVGDSAGRARAESMLTARGYTAETIAGLGSVFLKQQGAERTDASPPPGP